MSKFFRCDFSFKQIKSASKKIQHLPEDHISLLNKSAIDYYRAKSKENFKFKTWSDDESSEPSG